MYIPTLDIRFTKEHNNEVYFRCSDELRRVLGQKNSVYLNLELPGGLTTVKVGFPVQLATRIYIGGNIIVGVFSRRVEFRLLTETQESRYFQIPKRVRYRYGMELPPWMFDGYLEYEMRKKFIEDATVNYTVLNGSSGHSGVVIRVNRRENRSEESMEIYSIDMGSDYKFAEEWRQNPNTQLLARFVPQDSESKHLQWVPDGILAKIVL